MPEQYNSPWWSREGIRERWDEDRATGPQKVILAKFVREAAFPSVFALIPSGLLTWYVQNTATFTPDTISIILSVFGGVFAFRYDYTLCLY